MTSWCLISWTVWTNAFLDNGGLPLGAAINWSQSSLRTTAVHYIISWPPSTSVWRYSHLNAFYFLLSLGPDVRTMFPCACWAISSGVAIAASLWTNWCLRCCCVWARGALEEAPVIRLNSDSITPGRCVCWAMTCFRGKGEEDDNQKWKVLRNI